MAASAKGKGRKAPAKLGPNAASRKVAARKAGKCQLCSEKTAGFSVVVNPPRTGKVSRRKAVQGRSFWCGKCANRKVEAYRKAIAKAAQ